MPRCFSEKYNPNINDRIADFDYVHSPVLSMT